MPLVGRGVGASPFVAGPRGWPLVGCLPAFGRDPLGFLARLHRDHGDAVVWRLGPLRILSLADPERIAEVLGSPLDHGVLDIGWMFRQLVGDSVIRSEGAAWRRRRALVQPAVRPNRVRGFAPAMAECAAEHLDGWTDGQRVDVLREMTLLTQRIAVRTLFGAEPGARAAALAGAMAEAAHEIGVELRGPGVLLPGWVPTPARRRIRRAVGVIDTELGELVRERAREGSADDLVGRLLAARDTEGRALTPREVRDEAVTLWAGGHETTATALTWAWCLLARSPDARDALHREVDEVLGGRAPEHADHDRLPWTRRVVEETLRLHPPVWLVPPRVAVPGTTVGGRAVPVGTAIWCSPWVTQRDARWFPDPLAFRPERWGTPDADARAHFPFGAGRRACLGARFAQVELVLLLAAVAQHFHLDVRGGIPPPLPGLVAHPASPVTAFLRRRDPAPHRPGT
ncbi:cytochrome P450 [Kitasatospora sp. NPDC096147]|uniref:cytochrome P450 n=1 Tax=Kitasatospora sp. NPDC096147 TaxID=3364093 RepID=UPI0038300A73